MGMVSNKPAFVVGDKSCNSVLVNQPGHFPIYYDLTGTTFENNNDKINHMKLLDLHGLQCQLPTCFAS